MSANAISVDDAIGHILDAAGWQEYSRELASASRTLVLWHATPESIDQLVIDAQADDRERVRVAIDVAGGRAWSERAAIPGALFIEVAGIVARVHPDSLGFYGPYVIGAARLARRLVRARARR